jgi:hypothetical protein
MILYIKFVAEWLSGDWSKMIVWSTTANKDVIYLTAQLQSPAVFNEISSQPEWGTLYHAMKNVSINGMTCDFPLIVGDAGWRYYIQDSSGFYIS